MAGPFHPGLADWKVLFAAIRTDVCSFFGVHAWDDSDAPRAGGAGGAGAFVAFVAAASTI